MKFFYWPLLAGLALSFGIVNCIVNEESDEFTGSEGRTGKLETHNATNSDSQVSPSGQKFEDIRKFVHSNSKEFNPNVMSAEILMDMNLTAKPCDNFVEFVCGNYMASGRQETHPRKEYYRAQASKNMKDLLAEAGPADEIQPLKNVRNLYQACMQPTNPAKANDLRTLKEILGELGGWPILEGNNWHENKFNWTDLIIKLSAVHSNYFFTSDCYNKACRIRPILSIFKYEKLSNGTKDSSVVNYFEHVNTIISRIGGNVVVNISDGYQDVIAFDRKIHKLYRRFGAGNMLSTIAQNEKISLSTLITRYPQIPFLDYLSAFTSSPISIRDNITIHIFSNFIPELTTLINNSSKRTLANYALLRFIADKTPSSNSDILGIKPYLYDDNHLRENECYNFVGNKLILAREVLYVRKYFAADAKSKAAELIAEIKAQTKIQLEKIDKLDNATIPKMLETVKNTKVAFGFPDEFFNDDQIRKYYDGLVIPKDNFIQGYWNLQLYTLRSFKQLRNLDLYATWSNYSTPLQTLSYAGLQDHIRVPAAYLHGSFFHFDQPNYLNYAGVGQYIATSLGLISSNVIDKMDEFFAPMEEKFKCQRYQVAKALFKHKPHLFGYISMKTEYYKSMGMKIAYSAYQNWLSKTKTIEVSLPQLNYSPQQMFWINTVHSTCAKKKRVNHWKSYLSMLVHLLESSEFRKDFQCPPNTLENPVCPKLS